jgi:hypothetical protein
MIHTKQEIHYGFEAVKWDSEEKLVLHKLLTHIFQGALK